ncbi:S9 family peptidase [Longimicrobium terrae]|uniref:Dipeptidyl-peptidase-4 n=1 Tax=Longimicrobium terrae TaxID=1639882 RepID=A0A841GYJ1_9BACT|nr:S9 family peptidase [Longimicrobium terrae]MBB4636670.1 dipeptidyl-peptidase-4 [Longimicrobium terrae]MBB6070806.1 dipeptidyl-peptidase-4 [Longimicrobium terrae]
MITHRRWLLAAALLALPAALQAQRKERFATLEQALQSGAAMSGRSGPRSVNWIEGGRRFSFLDRGADGKDVIRGYDPATGRDTLLFSAEGLTFPGGTEPFEYESFQWARDSRNLVFQANYRPIFRRSGIADYYIYSLADRSLKQATRDAGTAELSPSGTLLGFERGGDLYVTELSTGAERRLTRDAAGRVYNGRFDWVYEEEFGLAQAWKWSPDSRHIAFWQMDESAEPITQLSDLSGWHSEYDSIAYPRVGDPNARVRIGVVQPDGGGRVWLETGETGDFYIPRIYWTSSPDTLAVMTLNRAQNTMKLFFFDVNTGGRRQVFTESSRTWIDVFDFYAGVENMITFPAGSREFFWISDRDGFQHVYRYDYSGRLINQVTRGPWSVTRIEGIDPRTQTIYYTGTQASPVERQLYAVRFNGGGSRRITQEAGRHAIDMSPDAAYFIDRYSNLRQPRQVELWSTARGKVRTMEANAQVAQWLAAHEYSTPEIFSFTTSDGVRLDGSMVRPVPFDPAKKYPVVFAIYGGPGSQQVYNEFQASGWTQWLAQQGYIVVGVNNRASNNYGSAFMKVVYGDLGRYEAQDFAETARHLASLPYVDAGRVAIMGTSYGGYATLMAMELYPELFPVGIANSAVTDWRLYDSIYTERYMGLLADNLTGYRASSAVEHADRLRGHLLLVHSLLDDNVHPQHTMQLLTRLTSLGKDVDFRLYPPGRHGAAYDWPSSLLISRNNFAFLERWLKADQPPALDAPRPAAPAAAR